MKVQEEKDKLFLNFVQKAGNRIEDRKKIKTATLYIPALEENIKIRNLTSQEIIECTNSIEQEDYEYGDKYATYLGVIEPGLKNVSNELIRQGHINQNLDVCNMFESHELRSIATEILRLSGVFEENKSVVLVEELKK
ncbi:MAG: hypothetical protein R3Y29_08815 [bacterium]